MTTEGGEEPPQRDRFTKSTLIGIGLLSGVIAICILILSPWHQDVAVVQRSVDNVITIAVTGKNNTDVATNSLAVMNVHNITTAAVKTDDLLLLISITSGPAHSHLRLAARETWLIPCIRSPLCEYIFFVDRQETNLTEPLIVENTTFGDLVFRGPWCPFMLERHHHRINYGNFMETHGALDNSTIKTRLPEYQLRGMYKIDWKVCFTKWALLSHKMAAYHAYVEDDSFTCVDNLLHQLVLLTDLKKKNASMVPSIRAGTPMWDGFDDSSTLMSRDIAMVFATLYPTAGFNCSKMADAVDHKARDWLSWGNSWMNSRCGWRDKLKLQGVSMVVPQLHKTELKCEDVIPPSAAPSVAPSKGGRLRRTGRRRLDGGEGLEPSSQLEAPDPHRLDGGIVGSNDYDALTDAPRLIPPSRRLYTALPCPKFGGAIIHHASAGERLLAEPLLVHLCEYTLFVDKVKDEKRLRALWSSVSGLTRPRYHDFSPVLTREGEQGWPLVVRKIEEAQVACGMNATSMDGGSGGRGGRGGRGGNGSVDEAACQAWRHRHLEGMSGGERRQRQVWKQSEESSGVRLEPHEALPEEGRVGDVEGVGVRDYFGGWMTAHGL